MDRVRVGIIGLGNMGSAHAKAHIPKLTGVELAAVCDINPEKLKGYGEVPTFESSQDLIRSGLVDAVLIATPHYDHTTIGIDAIENNLHVLVEKPISVHKADCERLIAAYEKSGKTKVFSAMFNQRTDPHYQTIRNLIRSGEIGKVMRVTWIITNWFRSAAYYASGGWRATWGGEGGGVLLNQCPHNIDLYQWMFGMPSRVRAVLGFGKYHDVEVEDDVTAIFEHSDGAVGTFITSTGECPGTNRLEVTCDRGRIVVEGDKISFDRTTVSVKEFCDTTPELFGTAPTWKCEIPVRGYGGQHVEIFQNFIDAILSGKELLAHAVEGIHSVELANAMIFSGLNNGLPVELPLDSARYESRLKDLIANSKHEKKVEERTATDMASTYR